MKIKCKECGKLHDNYPEDAMVCCVIIQRGSIYVFEDGIRRPHKHEIGRYLPFELVQCYDCKVKEAFKKAQALDKFNIDERLEDLKEKRESFGIDEGSDSYYAGKIELLEEIKELLEED